MTLQEVQDNIMSQVKRHYGDREIAYDSPLMQGMFIAGLCEEAGEVAGIYKRFIRFNKNVGDYEQISEEHLIEELGDVLWYLTALCGIYGLSLEKVYKYNCKKLEKRYPSNE